MIGICILTVGVTATANAQELKDLFSTAPQETSLFASTIQLYQKFISSSDGDRCPMYPSCSAYAKKAFQVHGLLKGWILTSDRLIRCGHDEVELSGRKLIKGKYLTPDPLENNDFLYK